MYQIYYKHEIDVAFLSVIQGGPKKTGLFLRSDNFPTTNDRERRVICQKFQNFV